MASKKNDDDESTPSADQAPSTSELAPIGLSLLGAFVAARCIAVVSRLATALAAPVMGFYLFSTCPTNDSFDGKKELKRVLRGDKLSVDDPNKPKGFFEKAMAKVSASVEAEAAALAGCNVEILDILGLVKIASVKHPLTNTAYFWLGAVSKWRYVMARDAPTEGQHTKSD